MAWNDTSALHSVYLFNLHDSEHMVHQWRGELMPGFAAPQDTECDNAIIFGHHVAWLLEAVQRRRRVIAHFHEWQAGMHASFLFVGNCCWNAFFHLTPSSV